MNKFNTEAYYFYEEYRLQNPIVLFFKFMLTFGLYSFYWIYQLNLLLEEVDENAPDSRRLFVVLFLIPSLSLLLHIFLNNWMKMGLSASGVVFSFLLWSLVIFVSLLAVYDFCQSFARVTMSNELFWYFLIYPIYIALVLSAFNFYYTIPLMFVSFLGLTFMQYYLNEKCLAYEKHIEKDVFDSMVRNHYTEDSFVYKYLN